MGFALNLSLVLLAYFKYAACQDYCTPASWGQAVGTPVVLPLTNLAAGIRDWKVPIQIPQQCTLVNGLSASVCDPEPPKPDASFQDQLNLVVHRNSHLASIGTVAVTVYCN